MPHFDVLLIKLNFNLLKMMLVSLLLGVPHITKQKTPTAAQGQELHQKVRLVTLKMLLYRKGIVHVSLLLLESMRLQPRVLGEPATPSVWPVELGPGGGSVGVRSVEFRTSLDL